MKKRNCLIKESAVDCANNIIKTECVKGTPKFRIDQEKEAQRYIECCLRAVVVR